MPLPVASCEDPSRKVELWCREELRLVRVGLVYLVGWATVDKLWYISLLFQFVAALVYVEKYDGGF